MKRLITLLVVFTFAFTAINLYAAKDENTAQKTEAKCNCGTEDCKCGSADKGCNCSKEKCNCQDKNCNCKNSGKCQNCDKNCPHKCKNNDGHKCSCGSCGSESTDTEKEHDCPHKNKNFLQE